MWNIRKEKFNELINDEYITNLTEISTRSFAIDNNRIENKTFKECIFYCFNEINFINCTFIDCKIHKIYGTKFNDCTFLNCSFDYSDISVTDFSNSTISESSFLNAYIKESNFNKCKIDSGCSFLSLQCPEEGSFIGYKKIVDEMGEYICKLLIPEDAERSSATSRKCRCSKAKVLEVTNIRTGEKVGRVSHINPYTTIIYKTGEIVYPDKWDDNRFNECSHGIHFFITKKEALDY